MYNVILWAISFAPFLEVTIDSIVQQLTTATIMLTLLGAVELGFITVPVYAALLGVMIAAILVLFLIKVIRRRRKLKRLEKKRNKKK